MPGWNRKCGAEEIELNVCVNQNMKAVLIDWTAPDVVIYEKKKIIKHWSNEPVNISIWLSIDLLVGVSGKKIMPILIRLLSRYAVKQLGLEKT